MYEPFYSGLDNAYSAVSQRVHRSGRSYRAPFTPSPPPSVAATEATEVDPPSVAATEAMEVNEGAYPVDDDEEMDDDQEKHPPPPPPSKFC